MAKKKKTSHDQEPTHRQTLDELRKKGIELDDEDQISGGFADYPVPPTIVDPEEDQE